MAHSEHLERAMFNLRFLVAEEGFWTPDQGLMQSLGRVTQGNPRFRESLWSGTPGSDSLFPGSEFPDHSPLVSRRLTDGPRMP